jgi:hypothetical protein
LHLLLILGLFLLVVGGVVDGYSTEEVELISLDPKNNLVPDRFKNLKKFPKKIRYGGGALFYHGKNLYLTPENFELFLTK